MVVNEGSSTMTRGAANRKSGQTHLFVAVLAATSLVSVVAQVPVQDQAAGRSGAAAGGHGPAAACRPAIR